NVLILEFTRELAALSSDEFIGKKIVEKIGLSELIIGYDHRLGHDRDGNEQKLRELGLQYGFEVKPVYAVKIGDAAISSTKIRHAITDGEIRKANSYLGWNYSFSGIVVKGAMRGRTLGFPTINVSAENPRKLMPGRGVYVVRILLDGQSWFGIMNIGMRPTFGDAIELITEVYIFNFNRDVYGSRVTVEVLDRLRGEIKFQSADALIAQLETDKKEALNIINNLNN
ncbi:MAG: bifunctional riboflavin kinase/FMN adenylyltransferase, partial [Syntrophothermus sp.]